MNGVNGYGRRLAMALTVVVASQAGCSDGVAPASPEGEVSLSIENEVIRLLPGERATLDVRGDGGHPATFGVRDPSVATVSAEGVLRASDPGMTWAWARVDSDQDSVRVVVSFPSTASGGIALALGADDDPLRLTGVSRLYRTLTGDDAYTDVSATAGSERAPELELEDFFSGRDTLVVLRVSGTLDEGLRTVEPWQVSATEQGYLDLQGMEGAMVWIRDPDQPDRADLYVPVGDIQLEIDRSRIPDEIGPATGALTGRMSFEAAGLVVAVDEQGTRIVGQVDTETTRVFAEFDLAQRIHPLGSVRASIDGGPLPVEAATLSTPEVGLWNGGLLMNIGGRGPEGARYFTQVWSGAAGEGTRAVDPLDLEELMNGSALVGSRVFAWTESGTQSELLAGETLSNLALSTGGSLHVTHYEAPDADTWGLLAAEITIDEKLVLGGAPDATQSVTLDILAPIAPLSETVYPHQPTAVVNGDGVPLGAGVVRVGNGPLQLPGRAVETSITPVEGVAVTLRWSGGSATARTNAQGEFLFTGVQPGDYYLDVEPPQGYDFAWRQKATMGPLNLSADLPTWIPLYLSDAAGHGGLGFQSGIASLGSSVDGLVGQVRREGTATVVATLTGGDFLPQSGIARTKLEPGRYEVDLAPPAGYRLADGQSATVSVEVHKGREFFFFVGLEGS